MAKRKKLQPQPDVRVANHGSIILIEPVSDEAKTWVESFVATDMWMGAAFACEPRMASDIISGMINEGLLVQA